MKFILLLSVVALVAMQVVFISAEEFVCQEGVAYIENECNSCHCTPNKQLGCTLKACFDPEQKRKDLHECEAEKTFEKGCNKCWCVKDMGTVCTNNQC